ncbi:MAG: HNH endonuclease [Methylocella sp.]
MALTRERLLEVLVYDPETGICTWLPRPVREKFARTDKAWNAQHAGKIAGCFSESLGYILIRIDGELRYAHRLAWFYMTGEWPDPECDHDDLDGSNNRWKNLRRASSSQNRMNRRSPGNAVGLKGVSFFRGRFKAQIMVGGINLHVGVFDTAEEAHLAYCDRARSVHGNFARFD